MIARIALWGTALLGLAAGASSQDRLDTIEAELVGPMPGAVLASGADLSRIDVAVDEGERRTVRIPFVAGSDELTLAPVSVEGVRSGTARLLEGTRTSPGDWGALPRRLRTRSRPLVALPRPGPGPAQIAWILAAALVVVALRRLPRTALGCGAAAAIGVLLLPTPEVAGTEVTVLEGDLASGRVLEIRAAVDRVAVPEGCAGWIRSAPTTARYVLQGIEREGRIDWTLGRERGRIDLVRELPAGLDAALASLRFRRVWARRPGEAWRYEEDREAAEGFEFEGLSDPPSPPGWLVSGLPQGARAWLAEALGPAGTATWVRAF